MEIYQVESYQIELKVTLNVQAFSLEDALESVEDCLGPGEICGFEITKSEITKYGKV